MHSPAIMKNKMPIVSFVATIITMVIGILVIIGWFIHNDFLRSIVPGQVKMKFNVASSFVLSSIVLLLNYYPAKNKISHHISVLLSIIVSLIGALTLVEYLFGINLGIDEFFVKDELRTTATYYAGRMSPLSAINFLFIGTGLLLLNREKTATYQFYYLSGIAFTALFMLIAFNFIIDIPTYIRLAIHVAVGFITLPVAIWFAQPVLHKKISFERNLFTGFATAIIIIAVVGISSSYYSNRRLTISGWVRHSINIMTEAEQISSLTKDIESGGRGYIIMGDSVYLEHFIHAKDSIFNHVKRMRELTEDNPSQQVRIDSLSALIEKRIAFSELCIDTRNKKGFEAANELMAIGQGKFYADKIRSLSSEIQQVEKDLLAQRQGDYNKSILSFKRAFYFFLAGVFILLIIIFFSIRNTIAVRKKSEEQSRENEKQIQTIFNAAPDAVTVIDDQGIVIKWNTKAESLFGWKADEVIGKLLSETIIPSRYRAAHLQGMKHFLKTGEGPVLGKTIEIQAIDKNNVEIDIELSVSPTIVNDKHLFVGFVRDITERKKAAEKLWKAQKNFQLLVGSVKDYAIFLLDENGRVASWNTGAEHIKGYTAEEIIGKSMEIFYTPEELERKEPQRNLQIALQNGNYETEGVRLRKDGTTFYANIVYTSLIDDAGKLYGYAKVTKDITEKRRVEEYTRFLATITANIQDIIITSDNNFKITRWNEAAQKILEWKSEEVIGKTTVEVLQTNYLHQTREQILATIEEKGIWQGELIYHTKSGRPVNVMATASKLKDADGNITGNLILVRDITELKNIEKEIQKQNQNIQDFIDSMSTLSVKLSTDGKILLVNKIALQASGLSMEELMKTNFIEGQWWAFDPEVHARVREAFIKANSGTAINYDENIFVFGQVLTINFSLIPILNPDGSVDYIVGEGRDVTAQKKAEDKIRQMNLELEKRVEEKTKEIIQNEKRFRGLIENSYDMVNIINEDFETLYRSPSAYRITGWTDEENEKKDRMELTHPDDIPALKTMMSNILSNPGKPFPICFRSRHKDGNYIWMDGVTTNMLHDESVKGIVANFRDVTERKKAEEKIRESEEKFRTLVQQAADGIFIVDLQGNYLEANESAGKLTGYSIDELKKMNAADIVPADELKKNPIKLEEIEKGNPVYTERYIRRKDNTIIYVGVSAKLMGNGKVISILRDITERKKAEEEIKQLNADLEEKVIKRTAELQKANHEMEAFSYSVSHDLRAPLRGIIGFTNILDEEYSGKLDAEARRITSIIKSNTIKMGNLIDDLLSFSRTGRQQIVKTDVNSNEMIKEIIAELEDKNKEQRLCWRVADLPVVKADAATLRQVWFNFISNAIKYSRKNEQPVIEIGTQKRNKETVFFVNDNGVGFDEKYKNKLFKVFQRLHSSSEFEGTGVGLAIVEKIISKHGGKVWADGVIGKGACFYFSLPDK